MQTFGKLTWSESTPAKLEWYLHDHYEYQQRMVGSLYDVDDIFGEAETGEYFHWPILKSRVVEDAMPAHWIIEGEPHMRMRLKRLFARANEKDLGAIKISDSPEICLELLWFLERFPLEVSASDLKRLKTGRSQHEQKHTTLQKLLGGTYKPPALRETALPLREYQKVARDFWLTFKKFILGDDLGIGKTAEAIGTLVTPGMLPAVVVVKTHMPQQWRDEGFAKFAPWLNVHIANKGTPYKLPTFIDGKECRSEKQKASMFAKPCDVLILNYHKLNGWREFIAGWAKAIVYDDSHAVGHAGTDIYNGFCEVNKALEYAVLMTNTPIRNYGGEMFDVLDGLIPGCLGTEAEFQREWCGAHVGQNKKPVLRDAKAFSLYIRDRGLYLRRSRKDVGRELPPCNIVPHKIPCDPGALKSIESRAADLARMIVGLKSGSNFERFQAGGEFDYMLRQFTGIGKAPFIAEFVRMLIENGEEKVIVGVHHHEVYDILLDRLAEFNPVEYSGRTSGPQKIKNKRAFIEEPKHQVLLLSNRAGDGLDGLQKVCKCGVTGELDWSWTALFQWGGRFNRDGQEHEQNWYILHSDEGSDPFVSARIDLKKMQLEGIRDPAGADLEIMQTDPKHVQDMARGWLEKQGVKLTALATENTELTEARA